MIETLQAKKERLEKEKTIKENELKEVNNKIDNFELDPDDFEEDYKNSLNESGAVIICGQSFDPAYALKELDPTAYQCGLNDYVDGLDNSESKEFQDLETRSEELTDEIEAIKTEIEEIEDEIKDMMLMSKD